MSGKGRHRYAVIRRLLVATALTAMALAGGSAAQPPISTTPDKVGDAAGAPDVSGVAVSSNASNVTFTITFADRPSLLPDEQVLVVLDSDQSEVTGDEYGADMRVAYRQTGEQTFGWALWRWDGAGWKVAPRTSKVTFVAEANVLRIVLDRAELYGSWGFTWLALTMPAGDSEATDAAPDRGLGSYSLRSDTRPDPSGRDRGTIRSIFSSFKPRLAFLDGVKPGATLELDLLFVKLPSGEKVEVDDARCVAGVGGRALVPVRPCAWRIPAYARGKTVLVDVGVVYKGLSESGFVSEFKVT